MAKLIPELDELLTFTSDDLLVIHDTSQNRDYKIQLGNVIPSSLSSLVLAAGDALVGEDSGGTPFDVIKNTGTELLFGTDAANNVTKSRFLSELEVEKDVTLNENLTLGTTGRALKGTGFNGQPRDMIKQGSFDLTISEPAVDKVKINNDRLVVGDTAQPQVLTEFSADNDSAKGTLKFSGNPTDSFLDFKSEDFAISTAGTRLLEFNPNASFPSITNLIPFKTGAIFVLSNNSTLLSETSTGVLKSLASRDNDTQVTIGNSTDTLNLVGVDVFVNGAPITGGGGGSGSFLNKDGFDPVNNADIAKFNIAVKNGQGIYGVDTSGVSQPLLQITNADAMFVGVPALDTALAGSEVLIAALNDINLSPSNGEVVVTSNLDIGTNNLTANGSNLISNQSGTQVLVGDGGTDIVLAGSDVIFGANPILATDQVLKGTLQDLTTKVEIVKVNIADQVQLGDSSRTTYVTGDEIVFKSVGALDRATFESKIFLDDNIAIEGANGELLVNDITNNRVQVGGASNIPLNLKGGLLELDASGLVRSIPASNGAYSETVRDAGNTTDVYSVTGNTTTGGRTEVLSGVTSSWEMVNSTGGNLRLTTTGSGQVQGISSGDAVLASTGGDVTIDANGTLNLNGASVLVNGAPIGGGGGSSTLQQAYDLSTSPQIEIDSGKGALQVKGVAGVDEVIEVSDSNGAVNSALLANGSSQIKPTGGTLKDFIKPTANAIEIGHADVPTELAQELHVTSDLKTADGSYTILSSSGLTPVVGDPASDLELNGFITTLNAGDVVHESNFTIATHRWNTTQGPRLQLSIDPFGSTLGQVGNGALLLTNTSTGGDVNLVAGPSGGDVNINGSGKYNGVELATVDDTGVQSVVAGTGIVVDNSNPDNPVISASGGADLDFQTVLDAFSTATSQEPTALDTPIKVEFGAAQGTSSDPVQIDSLGNITFNEGGAYLVSTTFHFGRTTGTGDAYLYGQPYLNGNPVNRPIYSRLDDFQTVIPSTNEQFISVTAGDVVHYELFRDSTGVNDGGLFQGNPTPAGIANAPTAEVSIKRYVGNVVTAGPAPTPLRGTVYFSANTLLTTNKIISPVSGEGDWSVDPMGYYTRQNTLVDSISVTIEEFVTNTPSASVDISFRSLPANGTTSGPFNPSQGTLIGTVSVPVPNTVGANRFYLGYDATTAFILPAGEIVFCYISGQSVTSASGIVVSASGELI